MELSKKTKTRAEESTKKTDLEERVAALEKAIKEPQKKTGT